jgi:pSer/pThr/pTyr-binding forkhead associated (FHA) protein
MFVLQGLNDTRTLYVCSNNLTIGRKNGIPIPSDNSLSRSHCSLRVNKKLELCVTDLDSKYGTFLNGKKIIGEQTLKIGDVLALGVKTTSFK